MTTPPNDSASSPPPPAHRPNPFARPPAFRSSRHLNAEGGPLQHDRHFNDQHYSMNKALRLSNPRESRPLSPAKPFPPDGTHASNKGRTGPASRSPNCVAEDSPVEADRPAARHGRRRIGCSPGGLPVGRGRNDLHHRKGAPLGHVYYGHNLMGRAVNTVGLPKGTTSHDLRHHYASVLLAAGESVVAVAERLGHEDASLVLSTYGHLMPDSDDRTRSAIDAAWDAARATCAPDAPQDAQLVR